MNCVVTSPPYWGLRDYGMAAQIGLEPSVEAYIEELVGVFREVRRVLRDDGTLWINMGDAYYSPRVRGGVGMHSTINGQGSQLASRDAQRAHNSRKQQTNSGSLQANAANRRRGIAGLKPKDLIGLPWMLAFALRDDGWYLRQDIIWCKPNPMPESARDRCTKSHEYLFLFSKRERYYFDQEAILEPVSLGIQLRMGQDIENQSGSLRAHAGAKSNGPMKAMTRKIPAGWTQGTRPASIIRRTSDNFRRENSKRANVIVPGESHGTHRATRKDSTYSLEVRNKRSVWTIPTAAFKDAHFATFPPALVEPCILAGTKLDGMVLDPFAGAGTVGLVAQRLQRDALLIELNPDYAQMALRRIRDDAPLLADVRCTGSRVATPASESGPRTAHSTAPVSAPLFSGGQGETT